jgi:predicted phage terminase large subunit-like protein
MDFGVGLPSLDLIIEERNKRFVTRQQGREIATNARAASSLEAFIQATLPGYKFGWFNIDICQRLDRFYEAVLRGERPRMMLFAPPRHGKTEIVSRKFPAFVLGKSPDTTIISTSYSAALADSINRDIQRTIDSDEYRRIFPETTLAKPGAVSRWARRGDLFEIVNHRGSYRSAGVGGGITGMGGHILIVDDPIKDAAEAQSEVIRESIWDWYRTTFYSRQAPGAGILLIMTRWHTDDLAGRLIEAQSSGGDKWDIVSYPAIAEEDELYRLEGEALHPERYDLDALKQIESTLGSHAWSALYQQHPVSRDGAMFKRGWFDIVPAAPADADRARAWDLAATAGGGDWTAGVKMARDRHGVYYIEHVERFRGSALDVRRSIQSYAEQDGRRVQIRLPQDPGQAGKDQAEGMVRDLAGYVVHTIRETGSKEVRAMPFAAQCEARNVKLVAGHWNEAFLSELETFPSGKHDDQVDAAAAAFERLSSSVYNVRVSDEAVRRLEMFGMYGR